MVAFSDETLMTYADGELAPSVCAVVEAAMRDDPTIAARVAQHRALRARLQQGFAAELDETPPERLLAATRDGAVKVGWYARSESERRRWLPMVSMAACLFLAVGLGVVVLRHSEQLIGNSGGALVAQGVLASSLSIQLGADRPSDSMVQIGLSFVDKSGDYCRVFNMRGGAAASGVACHHANDWQIRAVSQSAGGTAGLRSEGEYRTAGSELPPLILEAVRQQIAGDPLDRDAESAARSRGWRVAEK